MERSGPGDAVVDRATVDSDGQFIFATLFTGYLDDEYFSPQEQLETLLNPPAHVAAFSKLDQLYYQILTRRPPYMHQGDSKLMRYQEAIKGILHVVVAWRERLSCSGVARILREEVYIIENIVRGPLRTLFKFEASDPESKIFFCHKSLGDYLSDPHRSREFHVPRNALDLLYHRILSLPPPPDPERTFSRKQLIDILHVVASWPEFPSKANIAKVLGIDCNIVDLVLAPLMGVLFRACPYEPQLVEPLESSFKAFLLDPHRSGEFYLPANFLDFLHIHILSRRPPSDPTRTFSREQLIGVLQVFAVWPGVMTERTIAEVLGVDRGTVSRVLTPFMGVLFEAHLYEKGLVEPCWGSFKTFLLDPHRSGEFHIPPNTLDLLYYRGTRAVGEGERVDHPLSSSLPSIIELRNQTVGYFNVSACSYGHRLYD